MGLMPPEVEIKGQSSQPPETRGSGAGTSALGNFYIFSTKIMHF